MTTQAIIAIPAETPSGWRGRWVEYDGYPSVVVPTLLEFVRASNVDMAIATFVIGARNGWKTLAGFDASTPGGPVTVAVVGDAQGWFTERGTAHYLYVLTRHGLVVHHEGFDIPQTIGWWPGVSTADGRFDPWTDGTNAGLRFTRSNGDILNLTVAPDDRPGFGPGFVVYAGEFGRPRYDTRLLDIVADTTSTLELPAGFEEFPSLVLRRMRRRYEDGTERANLIDTVLGAREIGLG